MHESVFDDDDDSSEDASESNPIDKREIAVGQKPGQPRPMAMAHFYYESVKRQQVTPEALEIVETVEPHVESITPGSNADASVPSAPPTPQTDKSDILPEAAPISIDINRFGGRNFVEDDADYEDLDEDVPTDPYKNQFMRIQAPACEVQSVSRVMPDVNHDRPNVQKKGSFLAGLTRAVSAVKIGDQRAWKNPSLGSQSRSGSASQTGLGSGSGSSASGNVRKSSSQAVLPSRHIADQFKEFDAAALQRPRESAATRPAALQKEAAMSPKLDLVSIPEDAEDTTSSDQQSLNNTNTAPPTDRLRRSATASSVTRQGRANISQVGRLLSRNRRKSVFQNEEFGSHGPDKAHLPSISEDRERRDDERIGNNGDVRASVSRIGRMMSLTRGKAANVDVAEEKTSEVGKQASPLSTSTISTTSVTSLMPNPELRSPGQDRDRARATSTIPTPNPLAAQTPVRSRSRLGIRSAGRMFSFSRRTEGSIDRQNDRGRSGTKDDEGPKRSRSQSQPRRSGKIEVGNSNQKADGRADKFFYSEIESSVVRESGLLSSSTQIRVPVIAMAEFSDPLSRDRWYLDGFTLPHNAVRRECIDLYDILISLAGCRDDADVCADDMNKFEEWWNIAHSFFRCYFEMEEMCLFPWVDAAGAQDMEVQMALKKMRGLQHKLENLLKKVDRIWDEKTFKTCGEMFALIYKAVDEFVPRLMNYISDQEVLLPAIVKEYYKKEHRGELDKQIVSTFMDDRFAKERRESAKHNLILLVRWISKPRQLKAWIGRNLNSSARNMYPQWYENYEEEHASLLKQLRSRGKETGDN